MVSLVKLSEVTEVKYLKIKNPSNYISFCIVLIVFLINYLINPNETHVGDSFSGMAHVFVQTYVC